MFNFNEEAVRKEHENGVGIIAKTQEVVDQSRRLPQRRIQKYFLYRNRRNYPLCRTDGTHCKRSRIYNSADS